MINSAIYNGTVIHKRFKPKVHSFKYSVFSLLIDLSELEILDKKISFFSLNKFNLISFFEKDHGDRDGSSLKNWVIKQLQNYQINTENIKIKLLCYPRIFGYVFNPLSVFYIYNEIENITAILYVFKIQEDQKLLQHNCSKKFHVSPFIEMNCSYFFRLLKPGQKISVIIDQYQEQDKILYASQDGTKMEFNSKELLKSYLKHPIMTFKIIIAIHYEAFNLWVKGIKFIKKKIKIK